MENKLKKVAKSFLEEICYLNFRRMCASNYLSKNCLQQKTPGRCVGIASFISDANDWLNTFPDFTVQLKKIEAQGNLVFCDITNQGTHLGKFQMTNNDKKSILDISDFSTIFSKTKPQGLSYKQSCRFVFGFEKDKISLIIIEQKASDEIAKQLGIQIPKSPFQQTDDFLENIQFLLRALMDEFGTFLTRKEMECLALCFCGFNTSQIAKIFKIPQKTIESYLQDGYQKLGCRKKEQAFDLMYERQTMTLWVDLGKLLLMLKKTATP